MNMCGTNLPNSLCKLVEEGTILFALVCIGISGCNKPPVDEGVGNNSNSSSKSVSKPPRIQTVVVRRQDLTESIEITATVHGNETVDLYAKVGGYLDKIFVDIGDSIKKGDVLARLFVPEMEKKLEQKQASINTARADVEQAMSSILQAKANIVSAEATVEETKSHLVEQQSQLDYQGAEYDRVKSLVDSGALNSKLLDEALFKRKVAEAALTTMRLRIRSAEAELAARKADEDKARASLQSKRARVELAEADYSALYVMSEYAAILAPFDAVVTKRFVDQGAFIQPADGNSAAKPLLSIASIDVVRIELELPMSKVRWLDRGDKVVFDRITVLPSKSFHGEVTRFAPALDNNSRTMKVEIDLDNPEHLLLPGYFGYVTLYLEEYPQTPVVPSTALFTNGTELNLYVVEGGTCKKRTIVSNIEDGVIVGISSGVEAGEQVVRAGAGQLRDGQKVVAVPGEKPET